MEDGGTESKVELVANMGSQEAVQNCARHMQKKVGYSRPGCTGSRVLLFAPPRCCSAGALGDCGASCYGAGGSSRPDSRHKLKALNKPNQVMLAKRRTEKKGPAGLERMLLQLQALMAAATSPLPPHLKLCRANPRPIAAADALLTL